MDMLHEGLMMLILLFLLHFEFLLDLFILGTGRNPYSVSVWIARDPGRDSGRPETSRDTRRGLDAIDGGNYVNSGA